MSQKEFEVISPVDSKIIYRQAYSSTATIEAAVNQKSNWPEIKLEKRIEILQRFLNLFEKQKLQIAHDICLQMGRPLKQAEGEVAGVLERANYLISIAQANLADKVVIDKHFLRRYPLGKVMIIAPWNFPYLTAINSIIPALLCGNEIILKHSSQTPLCGQLLANTLHEAGVPTEAFVNLYLDHQQTTTLLQNKLIQFISFTGSVNAGYQLNKNLSNRFIKSSYELGGKDPAIVLEDCNLQSSVESLVDGAFFNSGQSCCGVERIYVAESCFDTFVEAFISQVNNYQLGDPRSIDTTLGPMVNTKSANFVRNQIKQAIDSGAKPLINEADFINSKVNTAYLAPQVLINVNHQMDIMQQESFGPVVAIMPFKSVDEAIALANDSRYGLTASIWTNNTEQGINIGDRIDTGTVFINRCDYLHPALAWSGVKDTGNGLSLSHLSFQQLSRVKSFNLGL